MALRSRNYDEKALQETMSDLCHSLCIREIILLLNDRLCNMVYVFPVGISVTLWNSCMNQEVYRESPDGLMVCEVEKSASKKLFSRMNFYDLTNKLNIETPGECG